MKFLASLGRDAESFEVVKSAIEHKHASQKAVEVSHRNRQANGRLRDAVRAVRSSAFADFEAAVKHRDR